jgi:CPA1 family monovalent cation:H+ antiporter
VILVTLVGQGLLLPAVMRVLGFAHAGRRERKAERIAEFAARRQSLEAASDYLDGLATERKLPDTMVRPLKARYRDRLKLVERLEKEDADAKRTSALDSEIEFLLLARERDKINDLYRAGNLKDDPRRRIERELDLRDAQLTNLRADE